VDAPAGVVENNFVIEQYEPYYLNSPKDPNSRTKGEANFEVVGPGGTPTEGADLSLEKSLPTDDGYNQDVDPNAGDIQLHPGDVVTYRFDIHNNGPDAAANVRIVEQLAVQGRLHHAGAVGAFGRGRRRIL
jgi:uncharacterized repeat protein (TIGR01451 family)